MLGKFLLFLKQVENYIYHSVHISDEEKSFINYMKYTIQSKSNNYKKEGIILVPLCDDLATMKMIFKILNGNELFNNYNWKFYFTTTTLEDRNFNKFKWTVSRFLLYKLQFNYFYFKKLCLVYNISYKDVVFFNNHFYKSKSIKYYFKNKWEVLNFHFKGVLIGDLIYDTYLRFKSRPTIDLSDSDLYQYFEYSINLFKNWDSFFQKNKIDYMVIPYLSYIKWGIPGRLSIDYKINTFTFGSGDYIFQRLKKNHLYHTKDFNIYKTIFSQLNNKIHKREIAKEKIENRISGQVDDINYMRNTSFSNDVFDFHLPEDKKWALIFLHCFFDSPHVYGEGIFPDFYVWLTFILDKSISKKNIHFIFKPHPNGIPENKDIIEDLKSKYSKFSNIQFIDSNVSNTLLYNNKPDAIFTYHGTVAHEFAYLGFPVVNSSSNPHSNYEFTYNPKSVEEFSFFINNIGNFGLPENYSKNDILEFYYMHYCYYSAKLNSENSKIIKSFENGGFNLFIDYKFEELIFE